MESNLRNGVPPWNLSHLPRILGKTSPPLPLVFQPMCVNDCSSISNLLCSIGKKQPFNLPTFFLIYSGVQAVEKEEEESFCPPQATSCQQPSKASKATKGHSDIQKVKKKENRKKEKEKESKTYFVWFHD